MKDHNRAPALSGLTPKTPLDDLAPTTDQAFERAKEDMEAIFQEGMQLERQGQLNDESAKMIEAKLQAISKRLDRTVSDELSKIRAINTIPPVPRWKKSVAVLLLLAFVGLPLEFTVGESFVFLYSNDYKSALPIIFALTLPVFAVLWFRLEKQQRALSHRYPTWAVRWLIVYPLMILLSSSLVALSPFGWSALAGWAIGTQAPPQQAKILSVDSPRPRAGKCDQKAVLDINGVQTNICLEGRVVGPVPKVGDLVSLQGRSSFLGLYIEEIRVKRD